MTTFEIHIDKNGGYYPVYLFDTRFRPAILFGNCKESREECYDDISEIKNCVLKNKNIFFETNAKGFRFIIRNNDIPLAYSRYFAENKLMFKILLLLKNHIQKALIAGYSELRRNAA